ncbi:AT-rich DNA-binding protein [Longilinea arvoryzae]|uniref:Redox-sensing transcriptional repressor Rex n=1 Tax=Longilinea arvoryzae TaxID=360412 RepID=A0A0S7BLJ2_9CHLR|nr:redox-sensing transcriptional repressor Rex [Longilinea arvoryzae]GAP14538.1 AT-rich DNA-binding protein [Longilinea arvoryzae]
METEKIPDIVIGRLPRYLQALQRLQQEKKLTTNSKELGERLGISAAQIRKDLSQFGEFGKQGTGYSVPFLINKLQSILNVTSVWDIVLVGMGDLGHALARYQGFANHGFRVAMVFDNDPQIIGRQVGSFTIQDTTDLVEKVSQAGIRVAMLTVPASAAQEVAEKLVKAGVKAILSYAPITLNLPVDVHVDYIDPILKLQHMTYYLD